MVCLNYLHRLVHNRQNERGIRDLRFDPEKARPIVGMYVEITPSHACTTVNLPDRYSVIDDDQLIVGKSAERENHNKDNTPI